MADRQGIPLFMKDSLLTIVKESDMRREWPDAMLESKPGPGWKRTRYSTCAVCGMEYKKGEMATIEARGARGTSSQPLGFICRNCFPSWADGQGFNDKFEAIFGKEEK